MGKQSSRRRRPRKHLERLPYPDFPLSVHLPTGRFYKKIRGRRFYFGSLDEPQKALDKYLAEKDDLHAGRTPRGDREGLELRHLVNRFLTEKQSAVSTGELTESTFGEYYRSSKRLIEHFGAHHLIEDLQPEDFAELRVKLAQGVGLAELAKRVQFVRSVFKFGFDTGMTPAMRFGKFRKPSSKILKRARRERPSKMFEALEIRQMLDAASPTMKAMILLGINVAWGNSDVSEVPRSAIDHQKGVAEFPRPKTGERRRAFLWPETVKAIREALAVRPEAKDEADADQIFITRHGQRYVRFYRPDPESRGVVCDAISQEFAKLLVALKLKREGVGFYGLRHTFRTIADEVRDRPAVDLVMGHENLADMATHYRERLDDSRLKAVGDHVRAWLFPPAKPKAKEGGGI